MAKCLCCLSCLKVVIVDNIRYLVCSLCKTVYTTNGKALTIVIDRAIIEKVAEQKGWKIE